MRKLILIFLASLFVISCEEINPCENLDEKVDSLLVINDSLNQRLVEKTEDFNYWYDSNYDGQILKEIGIENPEEFIKTSLRERTDLIPLKPVLGGTMNFGNIQLLSNKWLIADFDDGHVLGKGIYKYELKNNGKLEFKLLDSIGPN